MQTPPSRPPAHSNFGSYSVFFASQVGANGGVHCFEPQRKMAQVGAPTDLVPIPLPAASPACCPLAPDLRTPELGTVQRVHAAAPNPVPACCFFSPATCLPCSLFTTTATPVQLASANAVANGLSRVMAVHNLALSFAPGTVEMDARWAAHAAHSCCFLLLDPVSQPQPSNTERWLLHEPSALVHEPPCRCARVHSMRAERSRLSRVQSMQIKPPALRSQEGTTPSLYQIAAAGPQTA